MVNDRMNAVINAHFGNRFYDKWADASTFRVSPSTYQQNAVNNMNTIGKILTHPNYSPLKGRFFNTPGYEEYMKKYLDIPFKDVLDYANTLMRPVYCDFTEVTENREFMKIARKFYAQLFIQETIYVTYNVFEGNTEYELPREQTKTHYDFDKAEKLKNIIKEKGGFDIWIKMDENEYSESVEFMHIDTNLTIKFPKWRKQLAVCKWGAMFQNNLLNGINIAGSELLMYKYIEQCSRMTGKKLTFTTLGNSDEQKEKLDEMLNNFDNYIHFNLKNTANLEPLESISGEDLLAIKDVVYYHFDRLKFEYGRVANTNPKGERMTSGENYKDISAIAARENETLEYLIHFGFQCQDLGNIPLEFAVCGIPEKEAIYSIAHGAQTPNMEKEMFGQIEGTNPRPPLGQKGIRKANSSTQWSH